MEISVGHQSSAILIALALIVLIIHLVRKRLLREEYSWLWLLTGCGVIALAPSNTLLIWISTKYGTIPDNPLFLIAIFLLFAIDLQFSIRLPELTDQVKKLA